MNFDAFHTLSLSTLEALAASLRGGALSVGISRRGVEQLTGSFRAHEVVETLSRLSAEGLHTRQMALLIDAVAETRRQIPDPSLVLDLVLSSPEVPGIPIQDTAAVTRTLFEVAKDEVLLVGYTVRNGASLFAPLHERMLIRPELRTTLCLDIARREFGMPLSEIVRTFAGQFVTWHWPWPEQPRMFYYRRSQMEDPTERGSLHAKCIVVDRQIALITSANFTEAAQQRNIEAGLLVRYEPLVKRLVGLFEGLIHTGELVELNLPVVAA